jgi:periplasmic divalent cation tolerance protein
MEDGERLARAVVTARLAACVNLVPGMRSIYRWKGDIEVSEECLLLIKSSRDLFAEIARAIEKVHPYEVPEVVALPIVEGSENYLSWLNASLGSGAVE